MNYCNTDERTIKDPYGFIYITTNMINGKRYIGQKAFIEKWKTYLGSGTSLRKAIIKYGRKNFIRIILDVAYSKEELNEKEILYISSYNAVNSSDFYNIAIGGMGGLRGIEHPNYGKHLSEDVRHKISVAHMGKIGLVGDKNPMYGKDWTQFKSEIEVKDICKKISNSNMGHRVSEDVKTKISKAHLGKKMSNEFKLKCSERTRGLNHWNYGNHWSDNTREKIKISNSKREIILVNTKDIFISCAEASRILNLCRTTIESCCNGKSQYVGAKNNKNYFIFMYLDDYKKLNDIEIEKIIQNTYNHAAKPVICLNNLKKFNYIYEAIKWCNLKDGYSITMCIKQKTLHAGKHPVTKEPLSWMYYDDYLLASDEDIKLKINNAIKPKTHIATNLRKIICLNNLQTFCSIKEATQWCGLKGTSTISNNLSNKIQSAGKHPLTGEKLMWMYYEDYLAKYKEAI